MALGLREGGAGELRGKDAAAASTASRYAATDSFAYEDMPPPAQQQMDRRTPTRSARRRGRATTAGSRRRCSSGTRRSLARTGA